MPLVTAVGQHPSDEAGRGRIVIVRPRSRCAARAKCRRRDPAFDATGPLGRRGGATPHPGRPERVRFHRSNLAYRASGSAPQSAARLASGRSRCVDRCRRADVGRDHPRNRCAERRFRLLQRISERADTCVAACPDRPPGDRSARWRADGSFCSRSRRRRHLSASARRCRSGRSPPARAERIDGRRGDAQRRAVSGRKAGERGRGGSLGASAELRVPGNGRSERPRHGRGCRDRYADEAGSGGGRGAGAPAADGVPAWGDVLRGAAGESDRGADRLDLRHQHALGTPDPRLAVVLARDCRRFDASIAAGDRHRQPFNGGPTDGAAFRARQTSCCDRGSGRR